MDLMEAAHTFNARKHAAVEGGAVDEDTHYTDDKQDFMLMACPELGIEDEAEVSFVGSQLVNAALIGAIHKPPRDIRDLLLSMWIDGLMTGAILRASREEEA